MVISPSAFPAAGISGSRSTALSVSTLSLASLWPSAEPGAISRPNMAAPKPSTPSASRRVGLASCRFWLENLTMLASGRTCAETQRSGNGQVARQHIESARNNPPRKHDVERAAAVRQELRRAGADQPAGEAAGD